jgi:hypothetical protein
MILLIIDFSSGAESISPRENLEFCLYNLPTTRANLDIQEKTNFMPFWAEIISSLVY